MSFLLLLCPPVDSHFSLLLRPFSLKNFFFLFNMSYRARLLVSNSLSVCLSKHVFILPSCWKMVSQDIEFCTCGLVLFLYFERHLKMLNHVFSCLHHFWWEISFYLILIALQRFLPFFPLLAAVKVLLLCLWVAVMCLCRTWLWYSFCLSYLVFMEFPWAINSCFRQICETFSFISLDVFYATFFLTFLSEILFFFNLSRSFYFFI